MRNSLYHLLLLPLVLATTLLVPAPALCQSVTTSDAAVDLVTRDLGGSLDDVRLWVDPAPLGASQAVATWQREIFTASDDGWLIFVDLLPGANWEHPCWYYFIDGDSGSLQRFDATTPPNRLTEMVEVTDGRDNPQPGLSEQMLERYSQRLRALPKPAANRGQDWALIISGGITLSSNHIRYWNDSSLIYRTLVEYYGYTDEQIRVCISDGTDPAIDRSDSTNSPADLDGDGDADIELPATAAGIEQVFSELAASLTESDQLFIFTTDHGGRESGWDVHLNLWDNQLLRDDELAAYIDDLNCETIICTFEQCYSGGMLDDLEGDGRIIATAARYDEVSYAMGPDNVFNTFAYHWTSAVGFADHDGNPVDADTNNDTFVSMHEAFLYAQLHDTNDETPQYSSMPAELGDSVNLWGDLEGVYLVVEDIVIDDDNEGASVGNGDGVVDYGETIELTVSLHNLGQSVAPNALLTPSTISPWVTLDGAAIVVGQIPGGGVVTAPEPIVFTVAHDVPDQTPFELSLGINETPNTLTLDFVAAAPIYTVTVAVVDDGSGGDGDGLAEPGEDVFVSLAVANSGSSASPDLSAVLEGTLNLQTDGAARSLGVVPAGQTGNVSGFPVNVSSDCPAIHVETMLVELSAVGDYLVETDLHFSVGPWYDSVEQDLGWTLGVDTDTATMGHWIWADPVGTTYFGSQAQPEDDHTADPGTMCFVTGNGTPGGSAGASDVDGGTTTLLSPVFDLTSATSATLNYWRWYTNNLSSSPDTDYWRVELTTDGTTWIALENTTDSINAWTEMNFDLSEFIDLEGTVRFRFVADDAAYGSLVEAAVDDITVTIERAIMSATPEPQASNMTVLYPCQPNPLSSSAILSFRLAAETPATVEVFDLRGHRVRTLHAGVLEAGGHRITFDANDDQRRQLAAGMYFVRLRTPVVTQVRQVTIIR